MNGTNDDELKRDLRAAYGANLPGEEFDRRLLHRLDHGSAEPELSAAVPEGARVWPWVVGAAALLLILAGSPFAWNAAEDELPSGTLSPVAPLPPVPAPPPAAPPAAAPSGPKLVIVVGEDGRVKVGDRWVSMAGLPKLLRTESSGSPRMVRTDGRWLSEVQVIIRAGESVGWKQINEIVAACADPEVRIFKIQFATTKDGEETVREMFLDGRQFPAPGDGPQIEFMRPDGSRIEAKIPRDGEFPKIAVELKRTKDETVTRVFFQGREIGEDGPGMGALDREIASLKDLPKDLLSCEIHAWAWVPHADVIRAIDAFMKSGINDITFVGTPPPGAPAGRSPAEGGDPAVPKAGELVRINLFLKDGAVLASFGKDRVVHDLDAALKILDGILSEHKAAGRTPRGWIEAGGLISQRDHDRIMAVFTKHGVEDVVLVR